MKESDSNRITLWIASILFFTLGVIFADFRDIHQNPTFIEPDEGETRVLNLHHRHYFGGDTVDRVEIRKDGNSEEWMMKNKRGEWEDAFQWDQGKNDQVGSQYP